MTLYAPFQLGTHFFLFSWSTVERSLHQKQIRSLPSVSMSSSGFTRGDRRKNTGVAGLLSSYDFAKSILMPSTFLSQAFPPQSLYMYRKHMLKIRTDLCYRLLACIILRLELPTAMV